MALLAVWMIAGCGDPVPHGPGPDHASQTSFPFEVWMTIGEDIYLDTHTRIVFTGVPSDSRCPSSVTCVWEGDAAVELAVSLGRAAAIPDTLHTNGVPRFVDVAGYRMTLLAVGPDPIATNDIPPDAYAARLRFERLAR
jgi:hypothetical protein